MSDQPTATPPRDILTIADLAERWGCSAKTVMARVQDPKAPLVAFTLGVPTTSRRRRITLRFRLEDVRRWEAEQVRSHAPTEPERPPEPISRLPGYTGPTRPIVRRKRATL